MRLSGDFGKGGKEEKGKTASFFSPPSFSPSPQRRSFLNPFRLAGRDISSVFSSLISLAVMLGLILIPGLYAWFNLAGEFDLYSRTKDLRIDVVNEDRGYSSPLLPLGVNFGSRVIKALQENPKFLWTETGLKEAESQVEGGEAYAAVEIPEGFSKDLMSIFSSPSPIKLKFLVNESVTPLSPKLTEEGAADLENEARQVFASLSLKIAISSLESLSSLRPGSSLSSLSSYASTSATAAQAAGSAFRAYSSALASAGRLLRLSSSSLQGFSSLLQASRTFSLKPLPSALPRLQGPDLSPLKDAAAKIRSLLSSPLLSSAANAEGPQALKLKSELSGAGKAASGIISRSWQVNLQIESVLKAAAGAKKEAAAEAEKFNSALSSLSSSLASDCAALSKAGSALSSLSSDLSSLSSLSSSLASSLSAAAAAFSKGLPPLPDFGSPRAASSLLASPVQVKQVPVWPVSPFGSAITPFYAALAMWIGCLLDCLVIKPRYSPSKAAGIWGLKRRHLVLGRWISIEITAFFQCEVVSAGCIIYMRSQMRRPWMFLLLALFCSLSFSSLAYALVRTFGEAGKMACELILIFQITASGGIYPLQMLPRGAAHAALFLPATWAISAMRPCIGGSPMGPYWKGAGVLSLFFAASWLLALGPGKLFSRISEAFSESLQSGGLAA